MHDCSRRTIDTHIPTTDKCVDGARRVFTGQQADIACTKQGRGVLDTIHGRSRMIIDPRIPTMPGRSTPGFHRPGRHCLLALSAKRREVFSESHKGWAASLPRTACEAGLRMHGWQRQGIHDYSLLHHCMCLLGWRRRRTNN